MFGEVSLNGTIFQNKDWTVSAGFNINFNKNNVDELADGVTGIYGTSWFSSGNPSNDFILEEDEAVGRVRGLKYVGMYTTDDFTYLRFTDQPLGNLQFLRLHRQHQEPPWP